MKRKRNGRGCLAMLLSACMVFGMLTGCGGDRGTSAEIPSSSGNETVSSEVSAVPDVEGGTDGGGDISLIASIKENFSAAVLSENYNKGQYNLASDYVFEFPCSEAAGYLAFKAFGVYASPNFTENFRTYNRNTYENGVIRVAPGDVVQLDANGSRDINKGTWGSLNELYLVQFIDLETGKDLEKPIVTPFSVRHDVKAPVIAQGVDEKNNYTLSWKPVEGAKQYVVYEYFGGCAYNVCCTTTETSVNVEEFKKQKDSEDLLALFKKDLENAGYDVDHNGVFVMNAAVHYSDELNDGYYTVIAIDEAGRVSGISNIVDVRDVAKLLPYKIKDNVLKANIETIQDVPAYVTVEMVDGSESQMIIDYHGAQAYKYPEEPNKIAVKAHVANTLFDSFMVVMTGMEYDQVVQEKNVFLEREDRLLSTVRSANPEAGALEIEEEVPEEISEVIQDPQPSVESSEPAEPEQPETTEESSEPAEPEQPETTEESSEPAEPEQPETTEESSEPAEPEQPEITEESSESVEPEIPETNVEKTIGEQLLDDVAGNVNHNLKLLGEKRVKSVLYAQTELEAWMACCLIAQSDVIPVPVTVFPEAANLNYLFELFLEAYRQNPTSGVVDISNVKYNNQYEALIIPYAEEREVRLNKAKQELEKAEEVVASVCKDTMSDYEKVLALNNYFCTNASYDSDSTSTNVDMDDLTESFIDAHTPYGILCKNYGVCESYSEAFILTSRMAGLESIAEIGSLFGGGHEWNRVKVDGKWCVLDVTNNDNEIFVNGLMNLSDEQMEGILVPSKQAVVDPTQFAATSGANEYYKKIGKSATTTDEVMKLVKEALQSDTKAVIRLPLGTTEEQAREMMQEMAKKGYGIKKGGCCFGLMYVEK